jgi:hypothetical protein
MNPRLRLALRLPAIIFFVLTSWFGLLSYVPFAYLQFLRHQLFPWLEFFVDFHHFLYWGAVLLAALSVGDDLVASRRTAWAIVGVLGIYGVWLLQHPLLPTLTDDRRSLVVGMAALSVPVAFALLDHLAARGRISWERFSAPPDIERRRMLRSCAATAIYLWAIFAVIAACRISLAADRGLSRLDYLLAVAWGLPLHLAVAAGVFGIVAVIFAVTPSARQRYALVLASICGAIWLVVVRIVFPAIAFRGMLAATLAALVASSMVFIWSGLSLREATGTPHARSDRSWTAGIALALLPIFAFSAVHGIEKIDWYFLLQKLIAFTIWILAFATINKRVDRPGSKQIDSVLAVAMAVAVLVVSTRALAAGAPAISRLPLAVDQYAAYDPSLMLLERTLSPASTELADLTRFLVANSNVAHARPASVDFAERLQPSHHARPHIFVLVVDSLRRDYLSPYNPSVHFTPAIDAFARESLTFTRAFTRYGGTGLSEPAIWSGALLPHKEYVTPFAPMNALEKLVTAEKYHRLISVDSILRQLLTPSADLRELDVGIQNRLYNTCRTLGEIRTVLPDVIRDGRPAFVFTQPQDVHLANVAIDREHRPPDAYAGFYQPYAARLERLDGCFGSFIKYLKDAGLYEHSVIVLTSDHGDSLGDEGRWGHAYTVFPEVMRVPLIVHLPEELRGSFTVDTDTVAFTTDITPTLYKLLGHQPIDHEPLFGMTLIGPDAGALAKRRQRSYLVASSYGPVYGLLGDNGEALYIIDGVNTAEHRYDLRRGFNGEATIVREAERSNAARAIRDQVEEIATFYNVEPVAR